ncbi:MAG: AraC family transcriptional regulator N-terminal domain-containing protein [Pseudomonas sp.]|jgi:AraC-like DNA-binding protein|uniref:AraC family transcriptional regulator n=1 Tax=Pseudomonadaceae TaxID=135621 RepID=UPI0021F4BCA2|nr:MULTISPECIES: AraC family transcriptional regulator [Pseudomonas]UYP29080.1 AraC family transcriptional regulator [Pseudomonas sp. Z8(2022)]
MVELMLRLAPEEGYTAAQLDGVTFMRSNRPLPVTPALYEPSIVIVIQGRKRGLHDGNMYVYDAQHYLVLALPLPFAIETEAIAEEPMLGVALRVDPLLLAELVIELGEPPVSAPATLYSCPMDARLSDATLRLLEALADPDEVRLLGPSIMREIVFRVLQGEQGSGLRATLAQNSHFGRIARVLQHIHRDYQTSLDVPRLAEIANMSVPAFHVHFKAMTSRSPLQYLKAVRLHQARLLMIRSDMSAISAAQSVGYESPSQFSREFKRLFGRAPGAEALHFKQLLALAPAVDTDVRSAS